MTLFLKRLLIKTNKVAFMPPLLLACSLRKAKTLVILFLVYRPALPPFSYAADHLVSRGFIRRFSMAVLHLFEQNHKTAPSLVRTKAEPVPGSIVFPQKLHFCVPTIITASASSVPHARFHVVSECLPVLLDP